MVERLSSQADLTLVGLDLALVAKNKGAVFKRFPGINDLLFVSACRELEIG